MNITQKHINMKRLHIISLLVVALFTAMAMQAQTAAQYRDSGVQALSNNDLDLAVEMFQKAVNLDPTDGYSMAQLGTIALERNNNYDALQYLEKSLPLLDNDELKAWTYYNLSVIYLNTKKGAEAVDALRNAVKLNPGNADYWQQYGAVCMAQGRIAQDQNLYKSAMEAFETAYTLQPSDDVIIGIIQACKPLKQHERALLLADQLVSKEPNNADYYYTRALARANCRLYPDALEDCIYSLTLNPKKSNFAWNNLGHIAFTCPDYAMVLIEDKIESDTENADFWRDALQEVKSAAFEDVEYVEREITPYDDVMLPVYNGGHKAMYKFIHDNFKYPAKAKKKKIEDVINVRCKVDINGAVTDAEVLRAGKSPELDAEAVRVCRLLNNFTPAQIDGEPVESVIVVRVECTLK